MSNGYFTYNDYRQPQEDLLVLAIKTGCCIAGEVLQDYLHHCTPIDIGYADMQDLYLEEGYIDKYYIIKVDDKYYRFWSMVFFDKPDEDFLDQFPEPVERIIYELDGWEVIE